MRHWRQNSWGTLGTAWSVGCSCHFLRGHWSQSVGEPLMRGVSKILKAKQIHSWHKNIFEPRGLQKKSITLNNYSTKQKLMNSKQVKERSCCTKCTSNNSVQDVLALLLCQTPTCCQTYSSVTKAWQDLKLRLGQLDIRKEHPNLDNESNTLSSWYMTLI